MRDFLGEGFGSAIIASVLTAVFIVMFAGVSRTGAIATFALFPLFSGVASHLFVKDFNVEWLASSILLLLVSSTVYNIWVAGLESLAASEPASPFSLPAIVINALLFAASFIAGYGLVIVGREYLDR